MAISSVTETFVDGGLNVSTPAATLPVVIGPASAGTSNTFALFADVAALRTAHGDGVGVLAATNLLAQGGPVAFVRSGASVAGSVTTTRGVFTEDGSAGAVTHAPDTGAGPLVTVDATNATRSCTVSIIIGTGGALETATFTVAIDGGAPSSPVTTGADPYTYTIPDTGVVVTFPAGTYVAADGYAFTVTQGGGIITPSGTANYDHDVRIEILADGILGTATFRYSLDTYTGDAAGDRTYSETLVVPSGGTYVMPNTGVTLTFTAGSFYGGDVYTFTSTAAGQNATDLAAAFVGITATTVDWQFCLVATSNGVGDETAHALLAVALQAQLNTLAAASVWRRGIIAAGGATPALALAEYASYTGERVMVVHGDVRAATVRPIPGAAFPRQPAANVVAARAFRELLSTDLKRIRSGPLAEVVHLFHDEQKAPSGLDAVKVSTMRTWQGLGGSAYITNGLLSSADGSDLTVWPRGLVIDAAQATTHAELTESVGAGLRTYTRVDGANTYPGVIDPLDAGPIVDGVVGRLNAVLGTPANAEGVTGHIQDLAFSISDTHNFLSSGILQATLSIKPLGYVDFVTVQIGFAVEV